MDPSTESGQSDGASQPNNNDTAAPPTHSHGQTNEASEEALVGAPQAVPKATTTTADRLSNNSDNGAGDEGDKQSEVAATSDQTREHDHDNNEESSQATKSALQRTASSGRKKRVSINPATPTATVAAKKTTRTTRSKAPATSTSTHKQSPQAKERLRQELNALHDEMEVAHYARKDKTGNLRRTVPRSKSKHATAKRRSLEKQDWEQQALHETSRRLRSSASVAAQMEEAVKKSLAFHSEDEDDDEYAEEEEEEEPLGGNEDGAVSTDKDVGEDAADHNDGDVAGDMSDGAEEDSDHGESPAKRKTATRRISRRGRTKSRRLFRLRAFKSHRLAQREGEAIALHIQGRHYEAIAKLKEIAKDKPSAPQVYSALGTVYEAMFKESLEGKGMKSDSSEQENATNGDGKRRESGSGDQDPLSSYPVDFRRHIDLATKAYGAFHVAAILYKKDYTLWVRGADISAQIADLYSEVLSKPDTPGHAIEVAKGERKRWLMEAKNDYQAAENLRPPGINVGAKLAAVLIELGNLSEAFTLLTEMKSRKNLDTGRRDFDASYRAWMLYADLNLRIGFECDQWNKGDYSNKDYVFRRWLRKHALSFDWQERRVQALVKALEAAAGTKCCGDVLSWFRSRAISENGTSSGTDAPMARPSSSDAETSRESQKKTSEGDADQDQVLLAESNADELANFDRTTADMDLPEGSRAAELRANERKQIYNARTRIDPKDTEEGMPKQPEQTSEDASLQQPLSASVATVVNIASELMNILLITDAYEGCYRVGEAVSLYLKERHKSYQQRVILLNASEGDDGSVVPDKGAPYDVLGALSDDEESVLSLSDDDQLQSTADESTILSMERGVLPPLLLSMYGIALLGAGKRRYLAVKCVESINQLPEEHSSWFDRNPTESGRDLASSIFKERYVNIPGKTSILAALSRMILSSKISDGKTVTALLRILESMDGYLRSLAVKPTLQMVSDDSDPICLQRWGTVLEISAALTHALCKQAESPSSLDGEIAKKLVASMRRTTELGCSLWKINYGGSLPCCVGTALRSSSEACRFLCDHSSQDMIVEIYDSIRFWISRFARVRAEEIDKFHGGHVNTLETANLPVDVDWLSFVRSKMSLRCHNFAVSTAIDSFSGWSEKEFSVGGLKGKPSYVGLIASEDRIAGHLYKPVRLELVKQWNTIQSLNPKFVASGRISELLQKVEQADWHQQNIKAFHDLESVGFLSRQGELDGLQLCTCFSMISIVLAQSATDNTAFRGHIFNALSVLLPLSQYIVNERLWGSGVGIVPSGTKFAPNLTDAVTAATAAAARTSAVVPPPPPPPPDVVTRVKKRKRRPQKPRSPYFKLDSERDSFPMANLIRLSASAFRASWGKTPEAQNTEMEDSRASTMAALHKKVHLLRSSFSLQSVQRAALEIAASLLEVAAHPFCDNSFLAITHAANYASKGLRGGSSDRYFKNTLPGENPVPIELLLVLGRADCLNAVGFVAEASFLVSYVAEMCASKRRIQAAWDDKWKFISIYAYNLSVLTRANTSGVFDNNVFDWKATVTEELGRARDDGLSMFGEVHVSIPQEDDDEEDEFSGGEDGERSEHAKKPAHTGTLTARSLPEKRNAAESEDSMNSAEAAKSIVEGNTDTSCVAQSRPSVSTQQQEANCSERSVPEARLQSLTDGDAPSLWHGSPADEEIPIVVEL